jgi:uncharacterized YigZ family protein
LQDSYKTIARRQQCELKIKRSRFISTAVPVSTRAEAEVVYNTLQKQFHDATHNCFAYRIGIGQEEEFRYSDDGEPSGTAGKPIYEAILSANLTDLLIVVTRYYGGIKLGTGGLARAYRDSARQTLAESEVLEKFIMQNFRIIFEHDQTSVVMKTISDFELAPLDTDYGDHVSMKCAIRLSRYDQIRHELIDRSHGRVAVEEI